MTEQNAGLLVVHEGPAGRAIELAVRTCPSLSTEEAQRAADSCDSGALATASVTWSFSPATQRQAVTTTRADERAAAKACGKGTILTACSKTDYVSKPKSRRGWRPFYKSLVKYLAALHT